MLWSCFSSLTDIEAGGGGGDGGGWGPLSRLCHSHSDTEVGRTVQPASQPAMVTEVR